MAYIAVIILLLGVGVFATQTSQCPGYQAINVVNGDSYLTADLSLIGDCAAYSSDVANLTLLVEYQTDTRLHVLIEDANRQVYQIQEQVLPRARTQNVTSKSAALDLSFTEDPFSFKITRTSNGEVIFDTSNSPLIFQSQYVQLRTSLPDSPNIYGLGEHSDDFRLPTDNYTRTLWNVDAAFLPNRQNLYGSHPVYFDHRGNAGTHGVFLLNANGMDVHLGQADSGGNYLEYNTLGGILDFYFLAGPEPASVSKQYAEIVGLPALMPYWSLGFHQCKYGWPNIDHVNQVVANYSAAGIPLETVWGDIDYMQERRDFTTDPVRFPLHEVRALVDSLHQNNQHYVQILDPGIRYGAEYGSYSRGAEKGAFIRAADGSFYRGLQWAGEVVWPDWFAPDTQDWWTSEIQSFYSPTTGIPIDGLWIDMNEVASFCDKLDCFTTTTSSPSSSSPSSKLGLPNRDLLTPAFQIHNRHGRLSTYTLATNLTNADSSVQYDTHNLYGTMMAHATHSALLSLHPTRRPFILTRSTSPGAGRSAAHWFGDNASTWEHYRTSIRQMLAFASMHGMPMVGSDVCGFNKETNEELCARWAVMGAWQPFYRNHADISSPDQEFYRWKSVADAARKAIETRYRLADYWYTALWRASQEGRPVVSPLWFWYPGDEKTWGVKEQWVVGEGLLVSPVVEEGSERVEVYLPGDVWWDFWTGERAVVDLKKGGVRVMEGVRWDEIPVFVRGGLIVPMRVKGGMTTAEVRRQNFVITVAQGRDGTAKGELYIDDGESLDVGENKSEITFSWDGKTFEAKGTFGYHTEVMVESVVVLGENGNRTQHGPWGLNKGFHVQI